MKPFIYFIAFLIIETVWNWYIIFHGRSPNHALRACFRAVVFFGLATWLFEWPYSLIAFMSFHMMFALPFNIGLNLMRHLAWNYIGATAWFDKQGRKWPSVYWMGQLFLLICGIGLITTYYV